MLPEAKDTRYGVSPSPISILAPLTFYRLSFARHIEDLSCRPLLVTSPVAILLQDSAGGSVAARRKSSYGCV